MKSKEELTALIGQIVDPNSPVGMDAVYVHALILEKLGQIEDRLSVLEKHFSDQSNQQAN